MLSNAPVAVLTAEWTKIRSLRSTLITLGLVFVISVGIGVLNGTSVRAAIERGSDQVRPDFDPVNSGFIGLSFGQLCLVAFGVLLVCGEYGSGTIRGSLAAVPRRGLLYTGKIVVGAAIALVLTYLTAVVAFLATQQALGPHGVSLGEAARPVLGAPLYLTLVCLFAIGVGTLLRSTALSLTVLFSLIFVLSPVANSVSALRDVARYLPDHAGSQIMRVGVQADPVLGPWTGLLVLAAWTAAALLGGYVVLRKRDA
jgi:ABC-type transport system involved in multi-copper enzyme maturation permease subunit